MLTIVDYGNTNAIALSGFIKDEKTDIVISASEPDILQSDKLILPHCKDISSSIKKLHLLNLFSILRIIKKPILGIGTGMHLMTKSFRNEDTACLGCFPVECKSIDQPEEDIAEMKPIKIIKDSILLNGISKEDKFSFESDCFIPSNEYTTSTTQMDGEITSSLEKDHLFGVQFNPERSGEAGLKILKNFLTI